MPRSTTLYLLLLLLLAGRGATAQTGVKNDTIKIDKQQFNLFHPTPKKYMRPMVPDRPGITESPYSVDAGHFQYEADVLRLLTRRDGTTYGHDWYINHALGKVGLSNRTDLQVGLDCYTATRSYDSADPSQNSVSRGLGDLNLRLKHTLVGDDNSRWALGLIGYVTLPTGGPRGDGAVEYGAVLPVVFELTKAWGLGGQVATQVYWDRETASHFLQLTPTFTTDYQFSKLVQVFAELVGYHDVRQPDWQSSVNTGMQLDLSDNVQLDFGTHLPLTNSVDREYFFGLSFRR